MQLHRLTLIRVLQYALSHCGRTEARFCALRSDRWALSMLLTFIVCVLVVGVCFCLHISSYYGEAMIFGRQMRLEMLDNRMCFDVDVNMDTSKNIFVCYRKFYIFVYFIRFEK